MPQPAGIVEPVSENAKPVLPAELNVKPLEPVAPPEPPLIVAPSTLN